MNNIEQIDYYKTRFQILLLENNELQKQVELYKTISSMKEDLIEEQNKIIKTLYRRNNINDRINSNRKSKNIFSEIKKWKANKKDQTK